MIFMDILEETIKNGGALHHAYCFLGEREKVVAGILTFCEKNLGVPAKGSPDFWMGEFDQLGVDDARAIKEMQEKKTFGGGKKIFMLALNGMTREAQNSLLKVFEEPTPDTHFFLVMPSAENLLPTLRSRLSVIALSSAGKPNRKTEAENFLKADIAARMDIAKDIAKNVSDEKTTKAEVSEMLGELEKILHEKYGGEIQKKEIASVFGGLMKCRSYLNDRSSSVKMLLEYAAVIIPRP